MSAYETSVVIPSFAGLHQSGDGYNYSMRYARTMENVDVSGGSFTPMREGIRLAQTLDLPIQTLAYLHRRYSEPRDLFKTLLVAISAGSVYTKTLNGNDEWVERYSGLTPLEDFDWLTYEINREGDTDSEGVPSPVDVLLFTNATDGMFCLYGDTLEVEPVQTPYKFGVIARFNERIWGTGIKDMPDSLVYSAPYDPFDWEAQTEIPEDGAGEIMQPSWDGDSFVALRQYGSYLIAIKRNAVWRVYGTNPGEFVIQQQYGGGTIEENTVAINKAHVYMLGSNGILRYDGISVSPFQQDTIRKLMEEQVNHDALHHSTAAMCNGIYYLALPINGSVFCNAILEYNTLEYTFALRTNINVQSFLVIDDRLFYTSALNPGIVVELRRDQGAVLPCSWESDYQDLDNKSSTKSAFLLYALVEAEAPFELYFGIRTEKKLKQKVVMVKPGKPMRLHLNNQGRFFRLEIRSYSAIPFHIVGGVKIDLELDPD